MLPFIHIGRLDLPMYGLCMALGITLGFMMAFFRVKARGGDGDSLLLIGASSFAAGLLGAQFTYFLASYGLHRLITEILAGNLSGLENVGLVFYGGLVGALLGAFLVIRLTRLDFMCYCDAAVPCIPLGHAFGRIGCLCAGCCYGVPYSGAGAVRSPLSEAAIDLFPVQAVEALCNFLLFLLLSLYTHRKRRRYTLPLYLISYGSVRFLLEFLRGDVIRGMVGGLSTSQCISLVLIGCSCAYIFYGKARARSPRPCV